jgi:hypothetical protein
MEQKAAMEDSEVVSKKRGRTVESAVVAVVAGGKKKKSKQDKVAKIRQHNLDSSKKRCAAA